MKNKTKKKGEKRNKFLYWAPRVLVILFICFISLFAMDVFGEYGFPLVLLALFIHLIPSIILLVILIIAWKWERIGGWIYIGLSVIFTLWFDAYRNIVVFALISLPVLVAGILFLLNSKKRK